MMNPVAPYLSIRGGADAIAFYKAAFGADELQRFDHEGKVGHATLRINGGVVMLADEYPEHEDQVGAVAPDSIGGKTTVSINLSVDDADAWFERAVKAGAAVIRPLSDEFYGRHGKLRDPFGHAWSIVALKIPNEG